MIQARPQQTMFLVATALPRFEKTEMFCLMKKLACGLLSKKFLRIEVLKIAETACWN